MMLTLLITFMILGVLGRSLPQLNVFAVGFSFQSVIVLATMAFTLGTVSWLLADHSQAVLDAVRRAMLIQDAPV